MSVYCTPDAVRLAVNPDWRAGSPEPDAAAQDASSLTDEQLTDAIRQASARIDSYIGGRYQTPVPPVDPSATPLTYADEQIGYWARDLAAYLATLTMFRNETMDANAPVYLRASQAMADLVAVRDGKGVLNLPEATTGDASDSAGGFAGVVDPGSGGLFNAADAGYHPNPYYGYGLTYGW